MKIYLNHTKSVSKSECIKPTINALDKLLLSLPLTVINNGMIFNDDINNH